MSSSSKVARFTVLILVPTTAVCSWPAAMVPFAFVTSRPAVFLFLPGTPTPTHNPGLASAGKQRARLHRPGRRFEVHLPAQSRSYPERDRRIQSRCFLVLHFPLLALEEGF